MRLDILGTCVLAFIAATASAAPRGESLSVRDLDDRVVRPLDDPTAKAVVLLFVRTDCPISNRYAPEVQRLHERFADRGIAFWLVYAQPAESVESIRAHVRDYGLPARVLLDPEHVLVKKASVLVTPEAAVFVPAPDGPRLAYHGRIDDRYVDLGRVRPRATAHDLEDVLTAVLTGKTLPREHAPAIGCFIADSR